MKKGYVGLLACASGILIGLGISRLDLTGYLEKTQELGVICTNHWYVMDMHIRNHDEDGNLTGPQGNGHMGYTGTGEGGCFFHTEQMSDYGISEVSVDYGEDSIFDVKKVQNHLCQECLDKLETQKPKPRDLVLVDFQTLELYAIQEHNAGYFIRDYYVEIESEEDGVEVKAFYCPKLNNGKKDGE